MTMDECTIRGGEVKVFDRTYFEVVDNSVGVPIVIATFNDKADADDYAAEINAGRKECHHGQ